MTAHGALIGTWNVPDSQCQNAECGIQNIFEIAKLRQPTLPANIMMDGFDIIRRPILLKWASHRLDRGLDRHLSPELPPTIQSAKDTL